MRNVSASLYETTPRAIVAIGNDYPSKLEFPEHEHHRAQLMYANTGAVTVNTRRGSWVVPPERAVWIPPRTQHSVRMSGAVQMRSLYITPKAALDGRLPESCCVIEVSSLLRSLLEVAIDLPLHYPAQGREARVMGLVLDEIRIMAVQPLNAPLPTHPELAATCTTLLRDPGKMTSIDDLAAELAMSRSTFTRRFRAETGTSFGKWLQHARFLHALRQIADGVPITQVALDAGYASPSAFSAAFRRVLGHPPSRYFRLGEP
jgi:AraC-like DNA-binding protein/mannose-6-phosphate isomerase-like protein (cupin superfamily)